MRGYIKIHRDLLNWEWWDDASMVHAWLYMLLKASPFDTSWHGIDVPRGSFMDTVVGMAASLRVSRQQMRTILDRFQATNEITIKSTNKWTMVTICKYDDYQMCENALQPTEQPAEQPSNNHQITTLKEIKNNTTKKEKLSKESTKKDVVKVAYAENVRMTEEEHGKLMEEFGAEAAAWMIDRLNAFKGSKGKTYKSDYLAIRSWVVDSYNEYQSKARRTTSAGDVNQKYWNR